MAMDKKAPGSGDTWCPTALGQLWLQRALPWNLLSSLPVLQGGLNLQPALLFVGQTDSENSPAPGGLEPGSRPGDLAAASQGREERLSIWALFSTHQLLPLHLASPRASTRGVKGKDRGRGGIGDHFFSATCQEIRSPSKRLLGEAEWCYRPNWGLGIIYGFHLSVFPLVSLVVGN